MPDFRKILVRNHDGYTVETVARAKQLHEETRGSLWKREFVHQWREAYFEINAEGLCRACRKGAVCKRVRLNVVDLRHAVPRQQKGIRAVENRISDEQLRALYDSLPQRALERIDEATFQIFDTAADLCGIEMPWTAARTKDEARLVAQALRQRDDMP